MLRLPPVLLQRGVFLAIQKPSVSHRVFASTFQKQPLPTHTLDFKSVAPSIHITYRECTTQAGKGILYNLKHLFGIGRLSRSVNLNTKYYGNSF